MSRSIHTRTFPSSTRHLEEVRRFVERCALAAQLPTDTVEQFKIAVDEACTNVIKHAYHGDAGFFIDVAVIAESNQFTVRIRDKGRAFKPNEYKATDLVEAVKNRRPGGFGVHIMRQLMDRVEFRTEGQVNEVCLTKFLAPATTNGSTGT